MKCEEVADAAQHVSVASLDLSGCNLLHSLLALFHGLHIGFVLHFDLEMHTHTHTHTHAH